MGEVYKPEDIVRKKERTSTDLGPGSTPQPQIIPNLNDLVREVQELRTEIEQIKIALRKKGIIP